MSRRRVAITGMGAVTPFGHGVANLWEGARDGRSAARPIDLFDPGDLPVRFACQVPTVTESCGGARACRFAVDAVDEAAADAGLIRAELDPERVGVSVATGFLGSDGAWFADQIDWLRRLRDTARPAALADFYREVVAPLGTATLERGLRPELLTRALAARLGAEGPTATIMTSCPGSLQALALAAAEIRDGSADLMLGGGTESLISPTGIMGFARLHALSTNNEEYRTASRPFDRRRDGFVMGEGSGMLVLEEWDHAVARGAHIHAEWLGSGLSCDAYRLSDEHPDGLGALEAVWRAMRDARVGADSIGYVNAHGSSTPMNDRIETDVLRRVFGAGAGSVPISSTKSTIGHLIHAASAVEIIVTAMALKTGTLPPTAHLEERDPDCDLDYLPVEPRRQQVQLALKTSFGFGGVNAAAILRSAV